MITDYRLIGLSQNGLKGTLEFLDTDKEIFWAPFEMDRDRSRALFKWAKEEDDFWKPGWIATVKHEGLYEDNTPRKPIIVEVREWDLAFKSV